MSEHHSLEQDATARVMANWYILLRKLLDEARLRRLLDAFGPAAEDLAGALSIPRWDAGRFLFRGAMPYAEERCGRPIELYTDGLSGRTLAARRWPLMEVREKMAAEKLRDGRCSLESALSEVVLTLALRASKQCGPGTGICACYGAFLDEWGDVVLLAEHLPGYGLFQLARSLDLRRPEHEMRAWSAALALLCAVQSLHDSCVTHVDISLDNALLRPGPRDEVVFVDLQGAVACVQRMTDFCTRAGPYRAPETWGDQRWDAFAADFWACGVTVFGLAVGDYPWDSTEPGACARFSQFAAGGLQDFLQNQPRVGVSGIERSLAECLSPRVSKLLKVLLSLTPLVRESATLFLA